MSLFSGHGFEHPAALLLLALVPVIAIFYALALRSRRAAMERLLGDFRQETAGASLDRRALEAALATLCLGLCVIALAGPHWGKDREQVRRQGADVVVVLDLSRSMLAEDATPSRLGRARREIRGLLDAASADRVALVTFAGDARLTCPLTLDHDTLGMFVDEADPNVAHRGGSNLVQALEVAGHALEASSGAGKAVVVLSDGEDFSAGKSSAAVDAASKLAAKGTHVYAIGLGTRDGAKIPMVDERGRAYFFQDASGKDVVTRLESGELEAVAHAGGGEYLEASRVAFPMDELWRKRISRLARGDNGTQELTAATARFQWFLAPAVAVAALWWLLPLGIPAPSPTRRGAWRGTRSTRDETSGSQGPARGGSIAAVVAVLLLALLAPRPARADGVDEGARGDRLYRKGDYDGAGIAYDQASHAVAAPNGPFNLGNARFRAKKFREAARAFTEAEKRAADPETRRDASFNRGNALLSQADDKDPQRAEDLKAAIDSYDAALRLDPGDADARRNRAIAIARWVDAEKKPPQSRNQQQQQQQQQKQQGGQQQQQQAQNSSAGSSGDPQKDGQQEKGKNGEKGKGGEKGEKGQPSTPTPEPTAADDSQAEAQQQAGKQQNAESPNGEAPVNPQELDRLERMLDQRERLQRQLEQRKAKMYKQEGKNDW